MSSITVNILNTNSKLVYYYDLYYLQLNIQCKIYISEMYDIWYKQTWKNHKTLLLQT